MRALQTVIHKQDETSTTAFYTADRLSEVRRDERTHNAEERCEYKPGRLIGTGMDQLRNHSSNEPDDDRPQNTHMQLHGARCGRSDSPSLGLEVSALRTAFKFRACSA